MISCTERPSQTCAARAARRPAVRFTLLAALIMSCALAGCATHSHKASQTGAAAGSETGTVQSALSATPEQSFDTALALMKNHQDQKAIAAFQALAERVPKTSGPYTNLGILYARANQWGKAAAVLKQAVQLKANNAVANNWLGIAERNLGHYSDARNAYLQALKADPDNANAHLNLGILYDRYLHQPTQAIAQYQAYRKAHGDKALIVAAWIKGLQRKGLQKHPGAHAPPAAASPSAMTNTP